MLDGAKVCIGTLDRELLHDGRCIRCTFGVLATSRRFSRSRSRAVERAHHVARGPFGVPSPASSSPARSRGKPSLQEREEPATLAPSPPEREEPLDIQMTR